MNAADCRIADDTPNSCTDQVQHPVELAKCDPKRGMSKQSVLLQASRRHLHLTEENVWGIQDNDVRAIHFQRDDVIQRNVAVGTAQGRARLGRWSLQSTF